MTLTFDQWLGIAGLVAGIAGVAVGVGYGIKLDQKLKSARSAKKQIEKKFMHFMAAQEFDALALKASVIMRDIRRGQWAAVPATADELAILLGQARGARNPLLQSLEKD
ncbi:MAG: hypothetical protein KGL75_04910, partial [Acidobacteriota bacterium]|nr:hypothetical protein [Acidobacteriota bacterium]